MIQHRFISVRQTFMTNPRKERESKNRCNGKSPEEIYKPKKFFFSNLQTSENIKYSDKTEFLINDNITEATEFSENEIEYLESEFDITQFNLCNTQQWETSSANISERKMFCDSDDTSCSSKNNSSKASLSYHDSQLDILPGSAITKLAVHSSVNKKQTSDNMYIKENMYIKRRSTKKTKGSIVEEAIAKLGKSAETFRSMQQVYGSQCLGRIVFEWHKRFLEGRETLEDDKKLGRPILVRTPEIIEKVRDFVANDHNASLKMMEKALNISRETIRTILHEDLDKTKVCAKLIFVA
ncbi:GVQW3 protein, partial [Acromyrmex insinuator]